MDKLEKELENAEKTIEEPKKTYAQTKYAMSAVFTDFERNNKSWMPKVKWIAQRERELEKKEI